MNKITRTFSPSRLERTNSHRLPASARPLASLFSRDTLTRAALSLTTSAALLLAPILAPMASAAPRFAVQQDQQQNQQQNQQPKPQNQGPETTPAQQQQQQNNPAPGATAPDQTQDQNQQQQQVPMPANPAGQAQPQPQTPGAQVPPGQPQNEPATKPAQQPSPIEKAPPSQQTASPNAPAGEPLPQSTTPEAPRDLRADFSKRDYSHGNRAFPNIIGPYFPMYVPPPDLANTANIHQLIQDGKLLLSIDDVITLALQNNLNVNIARYTPFIAETDVLRSKSGQEFLGVPTIGFSPSIANIPAISFDPIVSGTLSDADTVFPVNNPFISGIGTTGATSSSTLVGLGEHSLVGNVQYQEGFHTGTTLTVSWDNTRSSSSSPVNFFNPSVTSSLNITVSQQLLNGFGRDVNTRFIVEARNERQAADYYFATQVIATIVTAENAYWELVFDRENVKVEEAALATSTKLYGDNKRQLEIGTMAPLDVLTAESEVATDRQNLILAQTTQLQQQTVLLNDITKVVMDPSLQNIEIVPTTPIQQLPDTTVAPLDQAVQEAFSKRPELKQQELLVKTAGIDVKATRNAMLPVVTLFGTYESQGLGGVATTTGAPTAFASDINEPILTQNGTPVIVNGQPVFVGGASAFAPGVTTNGGFTDAQSQIFHNSFPTYEAGINFSLPIRNRAAQADNARAQINQRMYQVQYQQQLNTVAVGVRNAQIALQQDRAQVDAAIKATELARQTLIAEQKKYALGASTSYNVILRSRDLTTAQGNELRARANLQEAMVNYDQSLGRTLEVNHVTVAQNRRGQTDILRESNIPGSFANVRLFNTNPSYSSHPSPTGGN